MVQVYYRLALFIWILFSVSLIAPVNAAGTNHVREFAKNKPKVFIVVSGPQAGVVGRALQAAILQNRDNQHSPADIPILTLVQAAGEAKENGEFGRSPVVFLLVGHEMTGTLPPALAGLLPFPLPAPSRESNIVASTLMGRDQGQVFTVGLFAPDAERLQKLYGIFLGRESDNFRTLPFEEEYQSNRLALFSVPANRDITASWGTERDSHVWNDIQWHDLSERDSMTPEQLDARTQIYFLNRSQNDPVPAVAAPILNAHTLKPTTIVIERPDSALGADIVVFSTPSRRILERKLERHPTLASLSGVPAVAEAVDLRMVKHTALLMSDSIPEVDREQVRLLLTQDIRQALGMEVAQSGPATPLLQQEIPMDQLQDAGETAQRLRREAGLRYVWHFGVTDYGGTTRYEPEESRITPLPPAFSEAEPTEPDRNGGLFGGHKKSDEDYKREMDQYHRDHHAWEVKKREYNYRIQNASYEWNQQINSLSTAHIHGVLTLFDLQNGKGSKVLWQQECDGTDSAQSVYLTQHAAVQGPDNHPTSLEIPPTADTCPLDILHVAVRKASRKVFATLQETALLPSDKGLLPAPEPETPTVPLGQTPPLTSSDALVADVADGIVTLNVGSAQGLKIGDRVTVALKTRPITDPATGAILDSRATEWITLRVSAVGATADCVPANAQEAAKLSRVKVGMPAKWAPRIPSSVRKPL